MALRRKSNRLREIRENKKVSGYDLQILSGIPARDIYLIERGLRSPRPYEKALIAKALGIKTKTLFPTDLEQSREVENSSSGLGGFPK